MISERDFISQIRLTDIYKHRQVVKGIGDDCAVFRTTNSNSTQLALVSTDTLMEGVHFDLNWHPPEALGRKAAAVNISDIAAMGGHPTIALLSLAVPSSTTAGFLDLFIQGFTASLATHKVMLVGGDTVKSNSDLVLSVTIFGEVDEDRVLYRNGARNGDLLWVSRHLGDAAMGLEICRLKSDEYVKKWPGLVAAHLDPKPEVSLGELLAKSGQVTAMMDMSDGLATDLAHLCKESGVGAKINSDCIPLSTELQGAAVAIERDALDLALAGGEDYALLFSTPASAKHSIAKMVEKKLGRQLCCIGHIVDQDGVSLLVNGEETKIEYKGYDHFT